MIGLAGVVVLALASTGAGRALLGGKKVREHRCPSCGADVASVGFLSWNGLGDSLNVLRTGSASPTDCNRSAPGLRPRSHHATPAA